MSRGKERGYQGRREQIVLAELGELSIHRLDKTSLLDVVHILSHEVAERDGDLRYGLAMAADVGQQHACDAA